MGDSQLNPYLKAALDTPGWRCEEDLLQLGRLCQSLRRDAVIAEVGCLFGRTSIILAGARKIEGTGRVHCIDPFDASGDAFSVPYYTAMLAQHGGGDLLDHFNHYIGRSDLKDQTVVHRGTDIEIGKTWTAPIDLLILDGDQSRGGARRTYDEWIKFLMPGGWLVIGNSAIRNYSEGHDGNAQLFMSAVCAPKFTNIQRGDTSFAQLARDEY